MLFASVPRNNRLVVVVVVVAANIPHVVYTSLFKKDKRILFISYFFC